MKKVIDTSMNLLIWWVVLMLARETLWRFM